LRRWRASSIRERERKVSWLLEEVRRGWGEGECYIKRFKL